MAPPAPRTALVTGGARRIGRAIALGLAADGWKVAVHYHGSAAAAEEVAALIRADGGAAMTVRADLAVEREVEPVVAAVAARLGPVGLLVNNASAFEDDSLATADRASWDRHMEANLRAPLVLMQAMLAGLPGDAGGLIVNLLDQRVWNLKPGFLSYTVSKVGLWGLTRMLALELAPRVRVNAIGPGPALPSLRQDQESFERQVQTMPLRRGTSPAEIVAALRFILAAPAMTGQMIALDGGQHLLWAPPEGDTGPE